MVSAGSKRGHERDILLIHECSQGQILTAMSRLLSEELGQHGPCSASGSLTPLMLSRGSSPQLF